MYENAGWLDSWMADWPARIEKAGAEVASKLIELPDDAWLEVVEGTWTLKDVIGHLAAWSDYLLDEVEALTRGDADAIQVIDINDWNAAQIAARRDWPAEKVQAAWEATVRRALHVVAHLPANEMTSRRRVAWTDDPVSPGDLLDLWLLHIEQHRESLTAWHERNSERRENR